MTTLSKDRHIYSMSPAHPHAYEIALDETVVVDAWDAFAGLYTESDGGASVDEKANPATGPIAIAGVSAGDTLAVDILGVQPYGTGVLRSGDLLKRLPVVGDHICFDDHKWLMEPMIGVIGVAPAKGDVPNSTPGDHGGNLDTNDVCPGARLHLKAGIDGANLAMGDVHAVMGDGETNGMGIEISARITIACSVELDPVTDHPYIVLKDRLIVIVSAETLDKASWAAVEDMKRIVCHRLSVDSDTARLLVGVRGHLRISQIVNPLKTVRLEMPIARRGDAWKLV